MLHWVQLGHTSLTHLKRGCQEMRCWYASCRFCLWTPRDFFVREGHIMDIPEMPEERIIVLDNKILVGKLSFWTSEFFKEVKACLRFFGTRTCRCSSKIQAVPLLLEKSQQYAVTIHSVSQRWLSKNLRDGAFSQLGQTLLAFMNTIMNVDILIRRISDHQLVAGLQDYEWQISPKCGSDGHLCHHYSHHRFGRFVRHCPSLPFTHFPPFGLEPALPRPFLGTLLTSTRYKKGGLQVMVMILMDYDDLLSCPALSLAPF